VPAQGEAAGPGSCIVAVTVTDNGSPNLSTTGQDTITINEVNNAPAITVNCPASTNEDTSTSCALTVSDPDVPAQILTCSLAPATICTGVTLTGCAAANVPAQGEAAGPGSCIVAVTVTDNGSPNLSTTGQDTITINEVNNAYMTIEWSYQQPIPTWATVYVQNCCKLLDPNQTWQAQETVFGHDPLDGNSVTCEVNPQAVADGSCQMAINTFELPMNNCAWADEYWFPAGGWQLPEPDWCSALEDYDGIDYDIGYPNVYYSPTGLPQDEYELYVGIIDNGQVGGNYYIDFNQVNNPPWGSIINPVNNTTFTAPATFNIDVFAVDIDPGDFVDYVILYQNGIFVDFDFTAPFSFTRTNLPLGNYAYDAVIVDSHGEVYITTVVNVTVALPINHAPTIAVSCPASASEDASSSCALAVADSDLPAQAMTCSLSAATTCSGATLTDCTSVNVPAQGEAAGPGSCIVAVTVTDNGSPAASTTGQATITINEVNLAPTINLNCPANVNEDTPTSCALTVADADLPAQALTCFVAATTTCTGVTLTGCTTANVPAQGETAPASCIVAVTVQDNFTPIAAATAQDTIVINEVNSAPTISVNCPDSVVANTATSCALTVADPDIPAQALTCTLAAATTCTGVTLTGCTTASVPAQGGAVNSCTVAVTVTDNGAPTLNATAQDTIDYNHPPVITCTLTPNNVNPYTPANYDINCTVTDPDPGDTITAVNFYENSINVETDTITPYVLNRTNMTPGTYNYYATATDNHGLPATSNAITVIVRYPPYMVFEWHYLQAGLYQSTLYDDCCLPIDPPQLWQAQGTVTGHDPATGNRIACVVNQTAIDNGSCIMAIHSTSQPLNECSALGYNDNWFPSGGYQVVPQYCSYLEDGDGNPNDVSYPTVRYSETGLPQDEEILSISVISNPWGGANYSIDFTTGLTSSLVNIIVGILIDTDGDGLNNNQDNCILIANPTQIANPANLIGGNGLRVGDACVTAGPWGDRDNDGYVDSFDNFPNDPTQH
jgi:phosphatidylethanolamine-binding protein (PEBP) family uncharacterized protein